MEGCLSIHTIKKQKLFSGVAKFLLMAFFNISVAQAQNWEWAIKSDNTTATQSSTKIKTDNLGNLFILGKSAAPSTINSTTLGAGNYLIKCSTGGVVEWVRNIQGQPADIICDSNGEIVVVGSFTGSIIVGGFTLSSNGGSDIYLLKFNSAGNYIWSRQFGSNKNDGGNTLGVDAEKNIVISGYFQDSIHFDSEVVSDTFATFFLTKLDKNGNVTWAKKGGNNYHAGRFINIENNGTIDVLCSFGNQCQYCNGSVVARFKPDGTQFFYNYAYGTYEDIYGFASNNLSNLYVVYNTGSHYSTSPTLVKYDSLMNAVWEKDLSAYGQYLLSVGLTVDSSGNAYIAGVLSNDVADSVLFDNAWLTVDGVIDIIVAKIDAAGNYVWYKKAEGSANEWPKDLCVDQAGNCYLTGVFNSDFDNSANGNAVFGNYTLYPSGTWSEMFIAKLSNTVVNGGPLKDQATFGVELFPNPSSGKVFIHCTAEINCISITNDLGQLMQQSITRTTNLEFDVRTLPKGVYSIELTGERVREIRRLMVQ
jgi:hypothetical protein